MGLPLARAVRNLATYTVLGTIMLLAVSCTEEQLTSSEITSSEIVELAPVESVEIKVDDSHPPQYFAEVVSGGSSGCVKFHGYEESRYGNTIDITVNNSSPSIPVPCTAAIWSHEFSVPLGTEFQPGETYSLKVNGVIETFVAGELPQPGREPQADVIRNNTGAGFDPSLTFGETGTVPPDMVQILAPIESVEIRIDESRPPHYFAEVVSGGNNGCLQFHGYKVFRSGNSIAVTVANVKPTQQVPCTAAIWPHEFNVPLGSDFRPGETYTVKVNEVIDTFVALEEVIKRPNVLPEPTTEPPADKDRGKHRGQVGPFIDA